MSNKKIGVHVRQVAGMLAMAGLPKRVALVVGLLLALAIGWQSAAKSSASSSKVSHTLVGKVVQVSDGDTINIRTDSETIRIRLASIDAPETSHGSDQPGQPFGEASRKYLASLVAGKTIEAKCFETDRFGRHICDIPIENTTANRLSVKNGMAWANQQGKGKYLRDPSLPDLEKDARAAKVGLWAEPGAVAPWVWRHDCWKEKKCK